MPWLITFALCLVAQTASAPGSTCLLDVEKAQLQQEARLDSRLKIYEAAFGRCENELRALVGRQESQKVRSHLVSWAGLLDLALKDIEASPGRKNRSKALRRIEIRLRRAIGTMQAARLRSPADQQEDFESWLTHAEGVRKKMVAILFPK
jgi:hypothetical protein